MTVGVAATTILTTVTTIKIPLPELGAKSGLPPTIYGYVWRVSGRHQIALCALSAAVFLMSTIPLELQRRIVNDVIYGDNLRALIVLCLAYAAVALVMGIVKLGLNIYRGYVGERATRDLRRSVYSLTAALPKKDHTAEMEGTEIAMVISEVEPVGGFVGISMSEPLLQGGLLVAIFLYMVLIQPWLALVALGLFSPQLVFVPLMQAAVNRRAAERIRVMRHISTGLIEETEHRGPGTPGAQDMSFDWRIGRVFGLNMQIFGWKFSMNFLMNLLYHAGVAGILLVGGWFVMTGRTQVGTVVAFISGLAQVNEPWGDLVNYFRESTTAQTKYRLIESVFGAPAGDRAPS